LRREYITSNNVLYCHRSSEERPKNPPFDGDILLDKLNSLYTEKFSYNEVEIQPVGCLWACSQGCVIAVSSDEKPTYLFVNLLSEEPTAQQDEPIELVVTGEQDGYRVPDTSVGTRTDTPLRDK
jgi:predicted metal-binding protein